MSERGREKYPKVGVQLVNWPEKIHLMLLAFNMPGNDGREVVLEIEKYRDSRRIPSVLFTTHRESRTAQKHNLIASGRSFPRVLPCGR